MISVYNRNETSFTHNGIVLPDVISCIVEEELNGKYTLELEHPIDKKGRWKSLVEENIIKTDGQLFRIYSTEKDLNYIHVYARHIFYDLLHNFLEDVRPTEMNGAAALNWILSKTQYPHKFKGTSDIETINTQYYIRKNPVEAILGEDSLVTRWNGELERDNFTIRLLKQRGQDKGTQIAYGKNMLGLEVKRNMDTVITRLMPMGREELLLPEKYIDSSLIGNYVHPYIQKKQFDVGIEEKTEESEGVTEEEAIKKLRGKTIKYMEESKCDIPYVNIKANLLLLENTEEYKHLKNLVSVNLGDIVSCNDNPLNIQFKSKVIRIEKDVLANRNIEVELGQTQKGIGNTLGNILKDISEDIKHNTSSLEKAIADATELLTNALGGHVVKRPGELLIMDTDDIKTAKRVWRWNLNGLGYSKNGINGPYELAMTINGEIVADFITTGVLDAGLIKAGVLSSHGGKTWINMDNGTHNIGDKLIFDGENLTIDFSGSPIEADIANLQNDMSGAKESLAKYENGKLTGVTYKFDGKSFSIGGKSGDIVEHDNQKSTYKHSDGSYTKISSKGLERYDSGTGHSYHYMTKIIKFSTGADGQAPSNKWIPLGKEFNNKKWSVALSISDSMGASSNEATIHRIVMTQGHDSNNKPIKPRFRNGQWEYPVMGYKTNYNCKNNSRRYGAVAGIMIITA